MSERPSEGADLVRLVKATVRELYETIALQFGEDGAAPTAEALLDAGLIGSATAIPWWQGRALRMEIV